LLPDFARFTVKPCLLVLRSFAFLLLLATLGSCSVYNRIFHPYRIPNPPASPEYKAKLKAEKERKKGVAQASKKAKPTGTEAEASTDNSTPTTEPSATPEEVAKSTPQAPKLKYDKHDLIKRNKMVLPKKRHKVVGPSFGQRLKNIFRKKSGRKKKSTPKATPDEATPDPNPAP
jgi:hypothetical protein